MSDEPPQWEQPEEPPSDFFRGLRRDYWQPYLFTSGEAMKLFKQGAPLSVVGGRLRHLRQLAEQAGEVRDWNPPDTELHPTTALNLKAEWEKHEARMAQLRKVFAAKGLPWPGPKE